MSVVEPRQFPGLIIPLRSRLEYLLRRRATWVLLDQLIVSAGNFLTGNLLGRTLPPSEYGIFGILMETMLYLNSLQAALIIYPLTIRGATGREKSLGRLATASSIFTMMLLPLLSLATTVSLGAMQAASLAVWAIAAMTLWQIQETLRRGLISELRMGETVWSDTIRYIGQAACIFVLARTELLTLRSALITIAGTSAASILVQSVQIGLQRISFHHFKEMAGDFWRLGRWMLLGNAGSLITTLGYWWTLRWTHGLDACGVFNAMVQMFRLTNPIMNGMTALIVPAVARTAMKEAHEEVRRVAVRYIALGSALLAPYFLVLAVAPSWSLGLFYRSTSAYVDHAGELQLFVANFTFVYFSSVITAWLLGLGHSRWNFYVQVVGVTVTLLIGLPITALWGVRGVSIGGLITNFAAAAAAGWFIDRAQRHTLTDTPVRFHQAT